MPYLPEEYTSWVVPTTATDVAAGTLGSWSNDANALVASGNGASQVSSGVGDSNILQCAPAPAGTYDLINDGADITKIRVSYEVYITRSGTYAPSSYMILMNNGTQVGAAKDQTVGVQDAWFARDFEMTKASYFPSGITGSQLKSGVYGPGYQIQNNDASEAGTTQIRGVQIMVYYQNPVPEGSGLIFSEF